jgi:hypothetical protein
MPSAVVRYGIVELGRGQADQGQMPATATISASLNTAPTCAAPSAPAEEPSRPTPATTPRTAAHSRQDRVMCDHPRGDHRGHREVRRDEGLHREQRQPMQRHKLGEEAEGVEADAGHEPPLVQHPHHETGIDASAGRVLTYGWPRVRRWPASPRQRRKRASRDDSRDQAD